MNRDTLIGFVLIALVLIGFGWWNQPSDEDIQAYQRQQDSIAAVEKDRQTKAKMAEAERKAEAEAAAKGDSTSLFFAALNGSSQQVVLKNEKVELTFDTKGGSTIDPIKQDYNSAVTAPAAPTNRWKGSVKNICVTDTRRCA